MRVLPEFGMDAKMGATGERESRKFSHVVVTIRIKETINAVIAAVILH